MSEVGTYRVFRPDPGALDPIEEHHRATFAACRSPESTMLVTVEGEVDAANSRLLARYVERHVVGSEHLILDLRLVDFFGTAGFAALHNVNVTCSRYGISWNLRAGRQTRRILAICDPDGTLPLEEPQSVLDELDAGAGDRELLVGGNH
ncbi:STAS domain-containing protein [Mycobacterium deserti]|uniref:STAS domain-containing protein n=1 Tax=Mycobacterium deserti TaxID=2978347 RepID=A0ABT2M8Q7_9MYCO|nr:STAS domain-containing protein [Mycobacterium deserti]MCT7658657.1 STAS domain-containing protein [Mycobacterium deserti]